MAPFRPTAARRMAWPMRKVFAHTKPKPHPQTVHLQRVRFQAPSRLRSILIGVPLMTCAFLVYDALVMAPLVDAAEKAAQSVSREELEKLDQRPPTFIPFPFTERRVDLPPYSRTDPEWQRLQELKADEDLKKKIRVSLCWKVLETLKAQSWFQSRIGEYADRTVYYLYFTFPQGPPPEIRRKGIEIRKDEIVVTERKMELQQLQRFERILWPSALTVSMWHFSWALFKQNLRDTAHRLGWASKPAEPASLRVAREAAEAMLRNRSEGVNARGQVSPGNSISPSQKEHRDSPISGRSHPVNQNPVKPGPLSAKENPPSGTDADGASTSSGAPAGASSRPGATSGGGPPGVPSNKPQGDSTVDEENKIRSQDLYPYNAYRDRIKASWDAFFDSWQKRWKPLANYPPHGYVVLNGIVEVKGTLGVVILDCHAFWDTKTRDFVPNGIKLAVRALEPPRAAVASWDGQNR